MLCKKYNTHFIKFIIITYKYQTIINILIVKQKPSSSKQTKDFQSDKLIFELQINGIFKELGNISIGSAAALSIFQKLAILKPILSEIGKQLESVDNEQQFQLYLKFRNIFKQFNSCANACTEISKQSLNGKFDPQKMEEIKNNILNVAQQLNSISQNVYSETKRYIIWVDVRDSQENKDILLKIQTQYQNSMTVKFYSDIDAFKAEFPQFLGHPLFFILSAQVANDYKPEDRRLFNWLKEQQNKDKIKTSIKGIVIFTSTEGVYYTKKKFMDDPSKLIIDVTDDYEKMVKTLSSLISPSKFCRIVPIEDFSRYFTQEMKNKLLQMHIENRKYKKLFQFHPDTIQLKKIFEQAEELVKSHQINFDQDAANFSLVLENLQDLYKHHKDEEELAGQLLRFYSFEGPFYKQINTCLNTMNEKLIEVFFPVIDMFATAIYVYNDSLYPETIAKGKQVKLYKGSSIAFDSYNNHCKKDRIVALPGFSSFTSDENIAKGFLLLNKRDDSKSCMFVYSQNMGSLQLPNRPKYISNHSSNPGEKEYMTYPCVSYKITNITPKQYEDIDYDEIELTLH